MHKQHQARQTPVHERQSNEAGVLQGSESTLLANMDGHHNE